MNITRRNALLGGLCLPLAALMPHRAFAATAETLPNPLMITISGIEGDADTAKLAALTEPFLQRTVPVTITVDPFGIDGQPLGDDSGVVRWMRDRIRQDQKGMEIGIHVDRIDSTDPYFQLRQASNAQAAFSKFINEYERYRHKAIVTALTMTTRTPLRSYADCASMRAAGIRSVIHLPGEFPDEVGLQPADGGYWTTQTNLVNVFASAATSAAIPADRPRLAGNVDMLAAGMDPIVIDLPFDRLAGMSVADLTTYAGGIADMAARKSTARTVRAILPETLFMQSRGKDSRLVVVRIDDLRLDAGWDVAQMSFIYELIEAGYPVSELVIPGARQSPLSMDTRSVAYLGAMLAERRYDLATHGWLHTPSELVGNPFAVNFDLVRNGVSEIYRATGRLPTSYVPPNNAFDNATLDAVAASGTEIFSAEKGDFNWFQGLDRRGLLHVSNTIMFEKAWSGGYPYYQSSEVEEFFGAKNDAVFSIHHFTANTARKRRQVLDMLESLSGQANTQLVNFEEYRARTALTMPDAQRVRTARADVTVRQWRPGATTPSERSNLLRDADLAWSYFDWGAKNFDGMVPATSWTEGDRRRGYPFTTMWDVASYIMAAISARRLDIIDQKRFETTIRRILTFLGQSPERYAGASLPRFERALVRRETDRDGFDSADTGRLLIALAILDEFGGGDFDVGATVAKWNFTPVLAGGEMHMVRGGRLSSAHQNNYANYVSRGYRLWGYDLKPVFETSDPARNMDEALTALAEIRRRGRLATEPHVTEEIELGGSPHGRLMADLVYSAQLKRFEDTGVLTCASEGPIAGAPYFAYQGYQMETEGGDFVVDAPDERKARQLRGREEATRMVSSKGAFLWNAARPGDYSSRLVDLIRSRGRIEGAGFSSGILEATGSAIHISDVNTNGIILETIAYVLGGRKPFMNVDSKTPAYLSQYSENENRLKYDNVF